MLEGWLPFDRLSLLPLLLSSPPSSSSSGRISITRWETHTLASNQRGKPDKNLTKPKMLAQVFMKTLLLLISWSLRTSTSMEILSRQKQSLQIFQAHHTSSSSVSPSTVAFHTCPCFVVLARINLHRDSKILWRQYPRFHAFRIHTPHAFHFQRGLSTSVTGHSDRHGKSWVRQIDSNFFVYD